MPSLTLPALTILTRRLAVLPVRIYQYCISPVLPAACRFYPTCSHYVAQAVLLHGVVRGGLLGLRRLARCHPWSPGGYDPVPPLSSPCITGVQE